MKKKYLEPELDITAFEMYDIIMTSSDAPTPGDDDALNPEEEY